MKKIKLIIFSLLLLLPIKLFAAGSINISTSNLTVNEGASTSFTVSASNAAGRIDIKSSNSAVADVNVSSKWLDNDSVTVTVTGKTVGTASVVVTLTDVASYDAEVLSGNKTVNVTVKAKETETKTDTKTNTKTDTKTDTKTNTKTDTKTDKTTTTKSKNNDLESISVEGYTLTNEKGVYKLTVGNSVTNITINAKAKDEKAKVTGTGNKNLKVGDNEFDVVITSESGSKNTIKLIITRKDSFVVDDIKEEITKENNSNLSITINKDIVTEDIIKSIKESKKDITLNKYNENNEVVYSITIHGSEINNLTNLNTNIKFESDNESKISSLSNYAEGIILNFEHSGKLPGKTTVKVNVSNKYNDKDKLKLYYFNEKSNKLELVSNVEVKDGYASLELDHCSEYFLSKTSLNEEGPNLLLILAITEGVFIVGILSTIYVLYKKKFAIKK